MDGEAPTGAAAMASVTKSRGKRSSWQKPNSGRSSAVTPQTQEAVELFVYSTWRHVFIYCGYSVTRERRTYGLGRLETPCKEAEERERGSKRLLSRREAIADPERRQVAEGAFYTHGPQGS